VQYTPTYVRTRLNRSALDYQSIEISPAGIHKFVHTKKTEVKSAT